ncbi:alanine racemase [Kineococcus endophyticus]|uniref:Alanine racemase n=1 Tax=Kineococcus endophyticus TaxID=1181883 RepID=A0ABV3P3W1_9ACTN
MIPLVAPPQRRPVDRALDGPRLDLDLDAVARNTRAVASATGAAVMAVVKADGYGAGAAALARTALANGATWCGVTGLDEALALRAAGVTAPVLAWSHPPRADLRRAVPADVDLAVTSPAGLLAVPPGARVHLHLDTGLAREGATGAEWPLLCAEAAHAERLGRLRVVGLMSHLACADEPHDPANSLQRRRFDEGVRIARAAGLRPSVVHLAATAGFSRPGDHLDLVRTGAALLGIDPLGRDRWQPAVSFQAPLVGVRPVRAGTPVGYGHTWTAPHDTVLGLLPVGYADGVPRTSGGRVRIAGRDRPLVGRVSMDQTVVDLGPLPRPGLLVGETAGFFGSGGPRLAEWARWSDRLEAELLVGLGPRVRRTTSTGAAA